jgi:hypothetical protein
VSIIGLAGPVSCRIGPLSSNVRPRKQMSTRTLAAAVLRIALVIAVVGTTSCASNREWQSASPEKRHLLFETAWNGLIGKPVGSYTNSLSRAKEKNAVDPGFSEYIVPQMHTCRIRLRVRDEDKVLISWQYESPKHNCAEDYYAVGA